MSLKKVINRFMTEGERRRKSIVHVVLTYIVVVGVENIFTICNSLIKYYEEE